MSILPLKPSKIEFLFSGLGLVYAFICAWLFFYSNTYADLSLNAFLVLILLAHFCWFTALYLTYKKNITIKAIFFWAIIFRLILWFAYPVLENDILRYMWDGYLIDRFNSAYGLFPSGFYLDNSIDETMLSILDIISYPDVATVYGPLSELVFYLAYNIAPGEIWAVKLFVISADILILWVLSQRVSAYKLLIYAWSPLILFQFSLNSHIDIVALSCLIFALHYASNKRWYLAPIFLALAISGKIFALLAIPFILKYIKQILLLCILLLVIYIPIMISGESEVSGLISMLNFGQFNSLFYGFGHYILAQSTLKTIALILFLMSYIIVFYMFYGKNKVISKEQALLYIYFVFLLCMPVVNVWYLAWFLVFAVYTQQCWPWVFSVTVWLALFTGINLQSSSLGLYEIPEYILLVEYGVLFLFFIKEKNRMTFTEVKGDEFLIPKKHPWWKFTLNP